MGICSQYVPWLLRPGWIWFTLRSHRGSWMKLLPAEKWNCSLVFWWESLQSGSDDASLDTAKNFHLMS